MLTSKGQKTVAGDDNQLPRGLVAGDGQQPAIVTSTRQEAVILSTDSGVTMADSKPSDQAIGGRPE